MSGNYTVTKMTADEVQLAIDWASEAGWNPGLEDATSFAKVNPDGFFIGKLDGKPIGVASAMIYDEHYAFFGLYLVQEKYRHMGYGMQITQERLKYVGDRNIGLDGVIEMADKYANIGFVKAFRNNRYIIRSKNFNNTKMDNLIEAKHCDFDKLLKLDTEMFSAPRKQFVSIWINQSNAYGLAYVKDETILGYGVIRKCGIAYKLGPMFAETLEVACEITQGLLAHVEDDEFFIDIPDINKNSEEYIKQFNMEYANFSCERMYTKGPLNVDMDKIYGISSLEFG